MVPVKNAPLDAPYFRCHVQPILTKSCSMFAWPRGRWDERYQ